jgi:hypothetical protein
MPQFHSLFTGSSIKAWASTDSGNVLISATRFDKSLLKGAFADDFVLDLSESVFMQPTTSP